MPRKAWLIGKYREKTTASTSAAIKKLVKYDDTYAAIAAKNAVTGDLYVMLEDVRDSQYNSTRFIFITKS